MDNFTEKYRILHIDDDANFLELFHMVFKDMFDITSLDDSTEAMEYIMNQDYDAIITDYEMPVTGGLELLCKIKAMKPELPVILETGQGNEEVAREAFILGASDYFTKNYFDFAHKEKFFNSVCRAIEIKKTREDKENTEKKYHHLYDRASEGIFIARKESIILANPAFQRMTGYDEEALRVMDFKDIIHSNDVDFVMDLHTRRFGSEDVRGDNDFRIITADKKIRWLRINASVIEWDNEIVTLNFAGDITDRKKMENKIRIERDKAQKYLDIAGVMFMALNLKGEVTLINKRGCEILGYEEKDIVGKNWFANFIPDEDIISRGKLFYQLISGNIESSEYHEDILLTADGNRKIIAWHNTVIRDKRGNIIGTLSSGEDITKKKEAQKLLGESEAKYRLLVENQNDLIVKSDPKFRLTFVSPNYCKIIGKTEKQLLGKTFFNYVAKEDVGTIRKRLKNLKYPPHTCENEERIMTVMGERRYHWSNRAVLDEKGNIREIFAVGRDITEKKLFEEAIQSILSTGASMLGEDFFREIVRQLARVLGADYTFVGEVFKDEKNMVKTISLYGEGGILDNISFEISNTPCAKAMKHKMCSFKSGVTNLFPGASQLKKLNIQGYVGVALVDSKNQQVGIMAALFNSPIQNVQFAESILQLFANRVASEVERRKLEEAYSSIVENSLQAIGIVQDYRLVFANSTLEKILGFSREHLLSLDREGFLKLIYPADRERIIDALRERVTGNDVPPGNELRIVNRNREVRYVETLARAINYLGKPAVQFAMLDITGKKRAEDETRLFKTIAQSANYGAVISSYEGYILYVNDYYAEIHGFKPNELSGKHLSIFHNGKQSIHLGQILKSLKMKGSLQAREVWHTKKDGTQFPMLMTHVLISSGNESYPCIAATAIDISDIKEAEKALRESEAKYRSLAENTPDIIMKFDRDCRYIYLNSEANKIMNADPQMIIGKTHTEIADYKEKHIMGEEMIRSVFETGEPVETEFHHPGPDGNMIYDWRLLPEHNEKNEIVSVMGIARDITEQKLAQERILESLREKEILLSEIHHRVKNNLQVIISLLGMQMDSIKDDNVNTAVMESMNRIKSMAFIHQRLYRSTDLAHVDFKGYIKVLTDNLIQAYNVSNNGLSIDLEIDDIFLKIDSAIPCGLILNELISNSLKHAFTGRKNGRIAISLNRNTDDRLTLIVQDNGIGIDDSIDISKQKSLGLRLVKLLVNQLRGDLEVDRSSGTKFVINFKG